MIAAAPIARWLIFKESGDIYMADVPLPECLDMMAYGALLVNFRTSLMEVVSARVCSLFRSVRC